MNNVITHLYPSASKVPDHVPLDAVFDYDIYGIRPKEGAFHEEMVALREVAPEVFWTPRNGGHWMLTRGADVQTVLNDAKLFSSRFARVPREANVVPPQFPIQADPPEHLIYRKLLMGAMSPCSVRRMSEGMRALTIELIEGFKDRGYCEFVEDFADQLPISVFLNMVNISEEDRPLLQSMSNRIMRPTSGHERAEAWRELGDYAVAKVAERRKTPGTDVISDIGQAKIQGEILSEDTIRGLVSLLLLGGLDTVVSMLTFFARFLALNPAHRAALVDDPKLVPNATEELLRRLPIANLTRCAQQDTVLRGRHIKAGDLIVASTILQNLDDELFPDALTVDFTRKPVRSGTFGGGPHNCIGSQLARAELNIFLEEWLKRIPDWQLAPGTSLDVRVGATAAIPRLPLVWTPTSRPGVGSA